MVYPNHKNGKTFREEVLDGSSNTALHCTELHYTALRISPLMVHLRALMGPKCPLTVPNSSS
jgi:hypothetical protein